MVELSYPEQLETQEWLSKRGQILLRDNSTCQFCGRQASEYVRSNNFDEGRIHNIGIDTAAGRITKAILELDNIKTPKEFQDEMMDEKGEGLAVGKGNYLLAITNRMVFLYILCSDFSVFQQQKEKFRAVRARIHSKYPVFVFFREDSELESLNLPIYYCQEDMVKLNVHHKYYLVGRNAWEYRDDALVTLCDRCHSQIHHNSIVETFIYRDGVKVAMNYTPCTRCGGVGYFPEYRKVENGICFRCRGNRYEELIPGTLITNDEPPLKSLDDLEPPMESFDDL